MTEDPALPGEPSPSPALPFLWPCSSFPRCSAADAGGICKPQHRMGRSEHSFLAGHTASVVFAGRTPQHWDASGHSEAQSVPLVPFIPQPDGNGILNWICVLAGSLEL